MNPKRLFNIYGDQFGTGYAGNVWDTDYIAPAIMTMQGGNRQPMIMESSKRLYNIFGWEGQGHGGNVYDQNALAPTLNTMMGGL